MALNSDSLFFKIGDQNYFIDAKQSYTLKIKNGLFGYTITLNNEVGYCTYIMNKRGVLKSFSEKKKHFKIIYKANSSRRKLSIFKNEKLFAIYIYNNSEPPNWTYIITNDQSDGALPKNINFNLVSYPTIRKINYVQLKIASEEIPFSF